MSCFARIRRTILHAGANEITVCDRIPLGVGAPPDPLCGYDEEVMNSFMLSPHSSSPPCPHDLWLVLDLDGDGQNRPEHSNGDSAWKSHSRFTLKVSWPASVSPPLHALQTVLLNKIFILSLKKKYPVQVALSLHRPIISSATPSSAHTGIMTPRRLHLARIRLEHEGIPIPRHQHREGEGVPLVVLLEPLVLGVIPASVLPIVATLLVVLLMTAISYSVFFPRVSGDRRFGEVVERARRELAERKEKERLE